MSIYQSSPFLFFNFSRKLTASPVLVNNFYKVHNFYKYEMTVKENNPTKLSSTNIIKHRTAIFGLVMDYTAINIHFFFESLACTGYNGTVIFLYYKIDESTIQYMISFSKIFEIIMIPINNLDPSEYINDDTTIRFYKNKTIQRKISGRTFQKIELLPLNFECGDFRFEVAYYLYKNRFFDNFDLLFLTDIGDVIFQTDIRLFNFSDGCYVVEEAGISIKDSHYWLEMYDESYSKFENKIELCIGTLILVGQKGFHFLNSLHNQIQDHLDIVVNRPNFQGTLNFLVYNNTYNDSVSFITTRYGIINSIAKLNGHMKNYNKNNFINQVSGIYDIYYHDKNYLLYNHDIQKLAVIHHTKYLPITQNFTFKGVLNICKQIYPRTFDKVMNIRSSSFILFNL